LGARLWLFKIVAGDFVAAVRLALPALVTFLKQLLIVRLWPGNDVNDFVDEAQFVPDRQRWRKGIGIPKTHAAVDAIDRNAKFSPLLKHHVEILKPWSLLSSPNR
jgi:hypothetical protein